MLLRLFPKRRELIVIIKLRHVRIPLLLHVLILVPLLIISPVSSTSSPLLISTSPSHLIRHKLPSKLLLWLLLHRILLVPSLLLSQILLIRLSHLLTLISSSLSSSMLITTSSSWNVSTTIIPLGIRGKILWGKEWRHNLSSRIEHIHLLLLRETRIRWLMCRTILRSVFLIKILLLHLAVKFLALKSLRETPLEEILSFFLIRSHDLASIMGFEVDVKFLLIESRILLQEFLELLTLKVLYVPH